MSAAETVIIATLVAAGVALVGLLLLRGEDRSDLRTPPVPDDPVPVAIDHDPIQRLSETLQALRKLSELRDEEIAIQPIREAAVPPAEVAPIDPYLPPQVPPRRAPELTGKEPARDLRILVSEVFSPSAPVSRRDLFAGRAQQMEDLVDTVYERGRHAVIYGERGVGKTSLASVMTRVYDGHETQLGIRVNCDSSDTYTHIWRKVFEQAEYLLRELPMPPAEELIESLKGLSRRDEVFPNDVRRGLTELATAKESVVFVDEFDTLQAPEATRLFADTIKMLSDQLVPATIIIIGVADDLDDLIEEHGSVRRALVQIHMPRMSPDELAEIVNQGLDLMNMKCEPSALDRITRLSQGFPHYTHLLAQASARSAIDADSTSIELGDVQKAVDRVVDRVHQSISEAYEAAVASSQSKIYEAALTAAALAPHDERGYFTGAAVKRPLARLMKTDYETAQYMRHLKAMCEPQRGPALQRKGPDHRSRYRFADPLLQPYVVMRGMQSGLITETMLDQFADA